MTLERALAETRTGDIWLFRGDSGPDRAIQTMTNAPVNHVGMTVAIDDLPPLIWHAELGDKLECLWSGGNHRGVQLNDLRQAVERWMLTYGQRCWLRQMTPYATREQEDDLLRVIARMDGTAFPTTARLTARWFRGRVPTATDWTRGIPVLDRPGPQAHRPKARRAAQGRPRNRVLRGDRRRDVPGDGSAGRRTRTPTGSTPASSGAATPSRSRPVTG